MRKYLNWSSGESGIITHSIFAIVLIILSIVVIFFAWALSMPTAYGAGKDHSLLMNFGLIVGLCSIYCFIIASIGLFRFLKYKDKHQKTGVPKVLVLLAGIFVIPPVLLATMLIISAFEQSGQIEYATPQENELTEQGSDIEDEEFRFMNRDELIEYAESIGIEINDSLSTEMIRDKIMDVNLEAM